MLSARGTLTIAAALGAMLAVSTASAQTAFDRSTPRRCLRGFVAAERRGDHATAARAISPTGTPPEEMETLARQLGLVLDRGVWIDVDAIADGAASSEGERVEIGVVALDDGSVPLVLRSEREGDELVWLVAPSVVWRIPELYRAYGPTWLERQMPTWLSGYELAGLALWQIVALLAAVVIAVALGRALAWIILRIAARVSARTKASWDDDVVDALRGPTRIVLATLLVWSMLPPLALSAAMQGRVDRMLTVVLIAAAAWLARRLVVVVAGSIDRHMTRGLGDGSVRDVRLRGVRTQVLVLRRVGSIVIGVVAAAAMLVQFEVVRTVGVSLLASAGIAGIVVGLAAQRSIATLVAGIQLSITQPFRLGDTVVVEGEWGTIEEINLTYVVVKIWDERRLIVPMSRFLENPFHNWTRVSPELLGTVFFHADLRLPVEEVRKELARILEAEPKWDRRVQGVVVTDAKEHTIEVRALVSARNAGDQWDLRCVVREKLLRWLTSYDGGAYLPRARLETDLPDTALRLPRAGARWPRRPRRRGSA